MLKYTVAKLSAILAVHLLVIQFILLLVFSTASAEEQNRMKGISAVDLVFSADLGKGEQVYTTSLKNNDSWTTPQQLSATENMVFHPVMAAESEKNKWVVWTQGEEGGELLYYSFFNGKRWSPARKIDSGITHNHSASLIIDSANTPWLAWKGFEESYSDVFFSRWDGLKWSEPARAHAVNSVPDIDPELSLDSFGAPVLSWKTFRNGNYVEASISLKDGVDFSTREIVFHRTKKNSFEASKQLPRLPAFVTDKRKAAALVKSESGYHSISFIHH
jgi:hypothetical protein